MLRFPFSVSSQGYLSDLTSYLMVFLENRILLLLQLRIWEICIRSFDKVDA